MKGALGFIGAGKMATALAKGFVRSGVVGPDQLVASDVDSEAREAFAKSTGGRAFPDNREVARNVSVVILAVKPDCTHLVLDEIKSVITPEQLVISIAAGVQLQSIEGRLCDGARVIRVMPNTPALVGASASAFARGRCVLHMDIELIRKLFGAVGEVVEVKETLLDAVTGLSGSGPAYVCLMIEALSDGGVSAGLPREIAIRLAAQTGLGTEKKILEAGLHPAGLREMVTSP
ncbi:MAG: pyrroline-5-carboxylate reductase, partial [Verrucomicrobiae bacterium]|nr:pyrroline-5-carboxylate reductase [Verrucomicrobiae bacterium]